jgi:hypothetical protein
LLCGTEYANPGNIFIGESEPLPSTVLLLPRLPEIEFEEGQHARIISGGNDRLGVYFTRLDLDARNRRLLIENVSGQCSRISSKVAVDAKAVMPTP